MTILYETDFYRWAFEQANHLKERNISMLDFENVIEELESMGKSEKSKFESHLKLLIMHLLKLKYQPEKTTNSWINSIRIHRRHANRTLMKNPSLKHSLNESFDISYQDAVDLAAIETGLEQKIFPDKCPWTFEEIMQQEFEKEDQS